METNLDRVRANVQAASTEDLLDRATVYREGMEPEALDLIEAELRRRGVTAAAHAIPLVARCSARIPNRGTAILSRRCLRGPRGPDSPCRPTAAPESSR